MSDLSNWKPRPRPERVAREGRFCRLEPLSSRTHGDQLFEAATLSDADDRFRYLPERTPKSRDEFQTWLVGAEISEDPLFFAVIDKATGKVEGRQTPVSYTHLTLPTTPYV